MPDIVPADIEAYCEAHTTPLPPLLEDLIRETGETFGPRARMLSGRVEGVLLQTLVASTGARRVLEVGTFTGFSALMMAAALPANGELITLELSAEHAEFARSYFGRSEHGNRIRLIEGPATDIIATLDGPFDLVFIDADKPNYPNYYDAALPLLADRGLIVVDNVLWSGQVLDPQNDDARAIAAFNDKIADDDRVSQAMLSIRDGITLIRKN
jgi:predicted O-methyltransferase YrrM